MTVKYFILVFIFTVTFNNMKAQEIYGRYEHNGIIAYGKVESNLIYPLNKAPWLGGKVTGEGVKIEGVKILCPSQPNIILGLGGSYKDAWEDKKPYNSVRWFIKPPSSAASPDDIVFIPDAVNTVKVEVELTIVIGKTLKNASESEAENAIFGYTIGNDIVGSTSSFYQIEGESKDQKDPLLGPGLKIGDRFAPFGPFIYTNFDWKNRDRKMLITSSSGEEKVNTVHNTSKLLYSPAKILSDLSKVLTLSPGDIVMTGTDRSYEVIDGDIVKISVDGLGHLSNTIKK